MERSLFSEQRDAQIVAEMYDIFALDSMRILPGDFLSDRHNLDFTLADIAQKRMHSPAATEPIGDLCRELLVFAENLLHKTFSYYPLAGSIIGWVAASTHSEQDAQKINKLLTKAEENFLQFQDEVDVDRLAFETFFCAGRTLKFESALGVYPHARADEFLRKIAFADRETYLNLHVKACLNANADHYPAGAFLLLANFKSVMLEQAAAGETQGATKVDILNNMRVMAIMSSRLAASLPDHSSLSGPIVRMFCRQWDLVNSLNPSLGIDLLAHCIAMCKDERSPTNKEFAAAIDRRRKIVLGSAAESSPDRPDKSDIQGRSMASAPAATALHPDIAPRG